MGGWLYALQAWQNGWLPILEEMDTHEDVAVAGQCAPVAIIHLHNLISKDISSSGEVCLLKDGACLASTHDIGAKACQRFVRELSY